MLLQVQHQSILGTPLSVHSSSALGTSRANFVLLKDCLLCGNLTSADTQALNTDKSNSSKFLHGHIQAYTRGRNAKEIINSFVEKRFVLDY